MHSLLPVNIFGESVVNRLKSTQSEAGLLEFENLGFGT